MGEYRRVLVVQPMENLDGQFHLNAARDVKKSTGRNQSLMQCSKLRRTKDCWLRHEVCLEKSGVLHHGAREWLKNDSTFFQLLRNNVAMDKFVAVKDKSGRDLGDT